MLNCISVEFSGIGLKSVEFSGFMPIRDSWVQFVLILDLVADCKVQSPRSLEPRCSAVNVFIRWWDFWLLKILWGFRWITSSAF